jgi:hypothetical protein
MGDRRQILRRDESFPLPRKMDKEFASADSGARFKLQGPAHVGSMNATKNAKGIISAIMHQIANAEMAHLYQYIIIRPGRSVEKEIIHMEGKESWERLKIHTVRLVRYKGKGTERLQKMREDIEAENEGVTISVQVRWLSNSRNIREREWRGEIKASSVVFIVRAKKVAQSQMNKGVIAVGVQYKVELYTNAGPDSLHKL